jgi:hypothetical protein
MLWRAGQQREARERRETLADLFVAARDASLEVGVSTGQLKAKGTWHLPSYMDVEQPVRSPESRDAMLAKLGAMFPGMVRRRGDA